LEQKAGHRSGKCPGFSPDELRVAFSIPSGSLFLVYAICEKGTAKQGTQNFSSWSQHE
jgi:hypothetical protein